MSSQIRLIKINPGSDGDFRNRPEGSAHQLVQPPTIYLQKLGTLWMQKRGEAREGITYQLDKLPDGYTVWEKPRSGNPQHVDKWCFGHPSGKTFDSPNRFFPHFLSLMEHGESGGAYCDCVCCVRPSSKGKARAGPNTTTKSRPPGRPAKTFAQQFASADASLAPSNAGVYKPKGRQWVVGRTDEEGTSDPYRNFIDKLKTEGSLDSLIRETQSMDWRAENINNIEGYIKKQQQKPSWIPRRMEMVLFVRGLQTDDSLVFDQSAKKFMISNLTDGGLTEPLWEVGVVTQTALEDCVIDDILRETTKFSSVTNSGFRVEPLSDANRKDGKGIWKQYTYVRLHQLRPFNLWRNFLSGIPNSKWHPTITNALTVMSTLALVQRYRFKGKWPNARVYCRAMYLSSELIQEGDYVLLAPEPNSNQSEVRDIMRIKSITLDMWNLDKASGDDYDDGHPYNCAARVTGTVFTISKERAWDPEPADANIEQTDLLRWSPWYLHTPAGKLSRVPFHRVMGRCYDPTAIDFWVHGQKADGRPLTALGLGLNGVLAGRKYSTETYRRIEEGRSWFWGDSRVEALDLQEVNGWLVASQDPERDPKKWRKEIRVIDGTAQPEERLALQQAERRASQRMNASNNSMLGMALNMDVVESVETSRDRKRSRSVLGRSEGDEDEDSQEEDEEAERSRFVDQIAIGMDDEEIPSSDDGEEEEEKVVQIVSMRTVARQPEVVID